MSTVLLGFLPQFCQNNDVRTNCAFQLLKKKSLSSERDKQVLNQTSYTQLPAKAGMAGTRPGEM